MPSTRFNAESVEGKPAAASDQGDVFLLGAGFSRAISTSMPLLQGLARHIAERFGQNGRIPPEVMTIMNENLAHALSYLEQAKPWLTEADNLRHRALFLEFSSVIARVLDEIVQEITQGEKPARPAWLPELIGYWHRHRCVVLTLNYDTLIEGVASSAPDAGRSAIQAQHLYPPLLSDAGLRLGIPATVDRIETFRLLKLHGSTNWYFSGRASAQGEPIYFVPPLSRGPSRQEKEEHELRLRAVADKYPFLVPPIYDKSALFTHETIRALWFEAGGAMKRARRIVCMGYSLPESDLTMKHFLRTSVPPDASLEVVDPSPEAYNHFRTLLPGAGDRVRKSFTGERCIEEFVRSVRPPAG